MLFESPAISTNVLETDLFKKKQVSVSVLRIDQIHPVLSGNKFYKLHYFLQDAISGGYKTIITFGGGWSNHLLATAFASRIAGLDCIGIVRGEVRVGLTTTLQRSIGFGMKLKFISREDYAKKDDPDFIPDLIPGAEDCLIIPEGGFHPKGAKGASLIMDKLKNDQYTHICTATGTSTTLAGLLLATQATQSIIGIPVLKGMADMPERIFYLTGKKAEQNRPGILSDCHFGGYAKRTPELLKFMNDCWQQFQLPLDFVYTAKMLFGVIEAIKTDQFVKGSNILCIHTGGLQGNDSLPADSLLFR